MSEPSPNPRQPGPSKTFVRHHWPAMTGITVFLATVGFPLAAIVRNNEAEYQATGDFGALFGHPFERLSHLLGISKIDVTSLDTTSTQYAALIANFPNLRLNAGDAPDIRALKISAINSQWKTFAELQIGAANDNEAQIRKQLFALTNDPRVLRDDPRTPGVGYRPTEDDIKQRYPGMFDDMHPDVWEMILPRPDQPAVAQLAAVEALGIYIKKSITADEEARADTEVTQPALARAREEAMDKDYSTHLHMVRSILIPRPLPFYGVELTSAPPERITLPDRLALDGEFSLDQGGNQIVAALKKSPEVILAPRKVAPLFTDDGAVLVFHNSVGVWDGDEWGFVPLPQYQAAHLPEKETDL